MSQSLFLLLIALVEKQFVINPKPNHYLSSPLVKYTISFNHIVIKQTLEHLTVSQLYISFSMLCVIFKLALVVHPFAA